MIRDDGRYDRLFRRELLFNLTISAVKTQDSMSRDTLGRRRLLG